MSFSKELISDFKVVGQLLGFVIKEGDKIKYLRVTVNNQEYWIKPAKEIRYNLNPHITPGCWIQISGTRKFDLKKGKLKLKADVVELANIPQFSQNIVNDPPLQTAKLNNSKKPCILVCQKSTCWQRGGREICQKLEQNLSELGLKEKVQIKTTGCLKQCKKGPNVIMMPDKTHYSYVQPQQIPKLLEKHISIPAQV